MSDSQLFDALVIGTGQAGPSLAVKLANAGQKVAIVERGKFGGTCVNTGCIPTKTMVASARAAQVARRAGDFGVLIDGPVRVSEYARDVLPRAALYGEGGTEEMLLPESRFSASNASGRKVDPMVSHNKICLMLLKIGTGQARRKREERSEQHGKNSKRPAKLADRARRASTSGCAVQIS